MFNPFRISSTLSRVTNVDLDDTLRAKQALKSLGYYQVPKHGMTRYPDHPLFNGIESFQAAYGLQRDGVVKPGGPTESKIGEVLSKLITLKKPTPREPISNKNSSMPLTFGLNATVGSGRENSSRDIVMAKRALSWAGHYPVAKAQKNDAKADPDFLSGIINFQLSRKLKADGWMGPGGETQTALDKAITPIIFRHFQSTSKKPLGMKGGEGGDQDPVQPAEPDQPDEPDQPSNPDEPDKPDEPNEEPCQELRDAVENAWMEHDEKTDEIRQEENKIAELEDRFREAQEKRPEDFFSEDDLKEFLDSPNLLGELGYPIIRRWSRGVAGSKIRRSAGIARQRFDINKITVKINEAKKRLATLEQERNNLRALALELEERFKMCEEGGEDGEKRK